jgi:hypothetical protein
MALTQVPPALLTATTGTGSTVVLSASPTFTGTVTTPGVTFSDASTQTAAASPYVLKNRIINGAMVINQRGFSGNITTAAEYTLDRWRGEGSVSNKFTVSQSSTAPAGFINSALITSSAATSLAAGDYYLYYQSIEGLNLIDLGWGTANAQTVTVSFKVYSSLTGTFGGAINNSDSSRSYPFTYSIPSANTWTTVSVTIPGDTSGTWLTTNGRGLTLRFGLGVGTTYSGTANTWAGATYFSATGATSVVGTSGATFYITGVQLEIGSTATPFERRLYNQELANCQRYFQSYGGVTANDMVCMGGTVTTSVTFAILQLPVTMRTSPTVGYSATSALIVDDNGASGTSSAISTSAGGVTSIFLNITTGATLVAMRPARIYTNGSSARLTWSAEL